MVRSAVSRLTIQVRRITIAVIASVATIITGGIITIVWIIIVIRIAKTKTQRREENEITFSVAETMFVVPEEIVTSGKRMSSAEIAVSQEAVTVVKAAAKTSAGAEVRICAGISAGQSRISYNSRRPKRPSFVVIFKRTRFLTVKSPGIRRNCCSVRTSAYCSVSRAIEVSRPIDAS